MKEPQAQAMGRRYFISKRSLQMGPFTKDQLRVQRLKPDTLVWHEERFAWVEARTILELQEVFDRPAVALDKVKWSFWSWLRAGWMDR